MRRVLVTGGSGFIGTNVVEACLRSGVTVVNVDIAPPRDATQRRCFSQADILDGKRLRAIFRRFEPTAVVHLAATTSLRRGATLAEYAANVEGVRNVVDAVAASRSVERSIFASTKLVCATGAAPSLDQYNPNTVYGESKVLGEVAVREAGLTSPWTIVRPTSIWGPWFGAPYRQFFDLIKKRVYMHVGAADAPRSFGYVRNVVFQVQKILASEASLVGGRVLYLSDYTPTTIREWGDCISLRLHGRRPRSLPPALVRALARCGDVLQRAGWRNVPLSSFRLANMEAATDDVPLDATRAITGPLPYSMVEGVAETVSWMESVRRGGCAAIA